jgi:UDP-N-acetylglucosamine/UDP-N-acetylgalactosamine diphosphorylase
MSPHIPAQVRSMVESWGQSHVFKYVDSEEARSKYNISDADIVEFVDQLKSVDFARVCALLKQAQSSTETTGSIEYAPPSADEIFTISSRKPEDIDRWWNLGLEAIRDGRVALTILAGGQGTRMGLAVDESKGMLQMENLVSKKYVFQLFIERLVKLKQLAGGSKHIPLLIMTSPINNKRVSEFLKSHKFFGYPSEDVIVFVQGTLPALTLDGDLLLESHARLAISPDGNGGIYNSLLVSGALEKLEKRGVESIHVIAVDNAIARPADPIFIGACIESKCEIGNKVVWKSDWKEKVGVIAKRNGQTSVVEYSDLFNPDLGIDNPLIRAQDDEGRLLFGAGNICNHYYSVAGLRKILPKVTANYHLAVKKISSVDSESGEIVKPKHNNGLKLESFIFDAFELAETSIIFEADRVAEFSPMKNAIGEDSPETAVGQILSTHKQWLTMAGAIVNAKVEIAPEVSYSGEGLQGLNGITFASDMVLTSEWMKGV